MAVGERELTNQNGGRGHNIVVPLNNLFYYPLRGVFDLYRGIYTERDIFC